MGIKAKSNGLTMRHDRSGIALVITLGFLAVLTVLAVGFAIAMRTERLASRSHLDAVKARQLIDVALVRAVDAVDNDMGTRGLVYPDWDYYSTLGGAETVDPRLLSSVGGALQADKYVPASVFPPAFEIDQVTWLPIDNPSNPGETIGRYAYMVINCTGLLDANYVGGLSRTNGSVPAEIQVKNPPLTDLNTSDPSFAIGREEDFVRFESVYEFDVLCSQSNDITMPSRNFFIYSLSPTGYLDTASGYVEGSAYIGARTNLWNFGAIGNAFDYAGGGAFSPGQTIYLRQSLQDYVDPDYVPQALDSLGNEPVPMISEIVYTNYLNSTSIWTSLRVEVWYPFVNDATSNFVVNVTVTNVPVAAVDAARVPLNISLTSNFMPRAGEIMVMTEDQANNYTFTNTAPLSYQARVFADVLHAGTPVDRIEGGAAIDITLNQDEPQAFMYEVNDPRMNWSFTTPSQWTAVGTDSLGETNVTSIAALSPANNDGEMGMYSANRPLLTLGELGYLPYGPWQTLCLFPSGTRPMHRVLDTFSITEGDYERGRVNPNSRNVDVLGAVFQDMPIEEYPGQPGAATVVDYGWFSSLFVSGQFTNRSDLGSVPNLDTYGLADNLLKRESIIRNSADLFSARQNMFTIILAAQTVRVLNGTINPLAEQRAIAVVWRDPYPDALGRYRAFVRFFKWLTE